MDPVVKVSNPTGEMARKPIVSSSPTATPNTNSSAASGINSSIPTGEETRKKILSTSTTVEPKVKSPDSSGINSSIPAGGDTSMKIASSSVAATPDLESYASSAIAAKPHGKAVSAPTRVAPVDDQVMLFRDVSLGPHEADLRFRLIHFWEAVNPRTKKLIGQEMLLIDEEGTVIQGFVPAGRVGTYDFVAGSVYKLTNFYGSRSKDMYSVAEHDFTVTFSWNARLSDPENHHVPIPEDRFRFHSIEEFQANCDARGDLYDYLGHMRLVNDQIINEFTVLDETDIAEKRHLCVHVQNQGGPVVKLHLWDQAAFDFCKKFKSYGRAPSVLLVTAVNPKRLGGTLALTTMPPSRVFMDLDVGPTREYLEWLSSNPDIANSVNAEVVTKPEVASIGDLFSYVKKESAKVAWFECTATIDDVPQGSAWYYISCGACHSKAVKGPNTLYCNNVKCEKNEIVGVPEYLTKLSVYDKSEQAVFVVLGEAGKELSGKHASELVASYFEANVDARADQYVPVPQDLLAAIGKTFKFIVKVSNHNFTGKTQSITVTKILPPDAPPPNAPLEAEDIQEVAEGTTLIGSGETEPSGSVEGSVGDKVRKASECLELEEAKRSKSG